MDCRFLLQGIFLIQGLNPNLLCCKQILYHLSHQGSPAARWYSYIKICVVLQLDFDYFELTSPWLHRVIFPDFYDPWNISLWKTLACLHFLVRKTSVSSILWKTLILNQLSSSSITGCLRPLLKEHDWVLQVKKEVQESLQSISQVHILNGPLSLHSPVFCLASSQHSLPLFTQLYVPILCLPQGLWICLSNCPECSFMPLPQPNLSLLLFLSNVASVTRTFSPLRPGQTLPHWKSL